MYYGHTHVGTVPDNLRRFPVKVIYVKNSSLLIAEMKY